MLKPNNFVKYIFLNCLILILSISINIIYSQDTITAKSVIDTTKKKSLKDTIYIPPIISKSKYKYINLNNPDTITRNRFLWYPLKSFEDIFSILPGYFLNYMDVGQIQRISYDQLDNHYTTVLRHGRPINDLIDGSVDFDLFSRNEIAELELSNGFANSLYNYNNVINVIDRQIFQNRPFSEISYWQDLNENLNFDGSFHKNFFNLLNFNFGITKHSCDGKYTNSSYDQWAGRFNFNYIGSKKFNAYLYSNYSKIQRGLNEGLDVTLLKTFTKEEVFQPTASVLNPNANEIRERFDIDLGAIYAYGKDLNSYSKIQLFESNSIRHYQDTTFRDVAHWINYGIKLQSVLSLTLVKDLVLKSSSEIELNSDIIFSNLYWLKDIHKSSRNYLLENVALTYKNLEVNGFVKGYKYAYFDNKYYLNYGINTHYLILKDSLKTLKIYAQYNFTNRLPIYQDYVPIWAVNSGNYFVEKIQFFQSGINLKFGFVSLKTEYYLNNRLANLFYAARGSYLYPNDYFTTSGINTNIKFSLWRFLLEINHQYNFSSKLGGKIYNDIILYPKNNGNISLVYHSMHFKNKLEISIGLNSRYFDSFNAPAYDSYNNCININYPFSDPLLGGTTIKLKPNATLDFFVTGKINKAIFGITFENILNRAFVSTAYYPNQNRGGLFGLWSRFNLTWYFLN